MWHLSPTRTYMTPSHSSAYVTMRLPRLLPQAGDGVGSFGEGKI
ncbi:hypothetical protein ID866_7602 [Astraeus odoratus]|nr:hypothetical protein ID866_7602 [Astraeus odoratus]